VATSAKPDPLFASAIRRTAHASRVGVRALDWRQRHYEDG